MVSRPSIIWENNDVDIVNLIWSKNAELIFHKWILVLDARPISPHARALNKTGKAILVESLKIRPESANPWWARAAARSLCTLACLPLCCLRTMFRALELDGSSRYGISRGSAGLCSTFHDISREWNSSRGIESPPICLNHFLALACLTKIMSGVMGKR